MIKIHQIFIFFVIFFAPISCNKDDDNLQQPQVLLIKGADVSYLPEVRISGIQLRNSQNQVEDMLQTLKNAGVNTIRLRLFKQPQQPTSGFLQVKNLTNECKNLGLKVFLSVHYSDTWADPSQQIKPLQWQNANYNQLKDSVFIYTKKIISEINPEYIQIGNEINNGFLFPEGSTSNLTQMQELLRSAINAVRSTNTQTKIILHYAGYQNAQWFFSQCTTLDYDIIGLSYYPIWHGKDLNVLQQNINSLTQNFSKKIIIAETSYPFTLDWNDYTNNTIGQSDQLITTFAATPQGQKEYLTQIKNICLANNRCLGFCYWGAEWISYKGNTATNASSWENQAFWDFSNKALPVLEVYQ